MFFFGYYIFWPVGITFFGLYSFSLLFNFLSFLLFKSACLREMPFFLHVWHITSLAGFLGFGFQFGAWQYMQFRSLFLSFDPGPFCLVYVVLCIGPSLMSFSRLDIPASRIVFFSFSQSYVLCWICSTTFSTSKSFSFISLSHNFLSVIEVIVFDVGSSVMNSGKPHSFFNSRNLSQWSSGAFLLVCFAQKNLSLSCICFFLVSSICYIVW